MIGIETVLLAVSLFFVGLLAGEEFVVRYGVRGALSALDDPSHIRMRQGLILRLRVLVPSLFIPSLILCILVAVFAGGGGRVWLAWTAVAALLVWACVTFGGTVPINSAAIEWDPDAPPADWTSRVRLWERLDTIRCWASMIAFALLILFAATRL